MSRAEIRRKFDEIVDFAEVEKFLDTPVKHYSSGMHVRLAFAVAAHLEPEAWSFQKPVIGCRIPAVAEVITEGLDGFLVNQDAAQIGDRSWHLLANPLLLSC